MADHLLYLFLDFDDTLSDHQKLRRLYVAELSSLLAADYGGSAAAWAEAIVPELQETENRYRERFVGAPLAGYRQWLHAERARLGEAVFGRVGIDLPDDEPTGEIVKRVQFDALSSCDASIPGAAGALRELFEAGVRTQIASSNDSEYLLAATIGAGIESYTESKFGPDLVDCAKEGPEFYRRIFEAAGAAPHRAVVVDDRESCLDWAEEAGARVIQACVSPNAQEPAFPDVLRSMNRLPSMLRERGLLP